MAWPKNFKREAGRAARIEWSCRCQIQSNDSKVLWDFAGQPNYRPIHALFLDDVDLALVLFDPSRQDTFTGVDYWLKQLSQKGQLCHSVLVAAHTDVSKLSHSTAKLAAFCRERGISGGFVATSAQGGYESAEYPGE